MYNLNSITCKMESQEDDTKIFSVKKHFIKVLV